MKGQILVRIFLVAMLLFASQEGLMSQTNQEQKVRNVVLVHGGFVDGSGWEDVGHGFDPNKVPDPLAVENLTAEHGRGIHLMKMAMDEVSFQGGGTEVHIWKHPTNEQGIFARRIQNRIVQRLVTRPWPSVRAIELGRGWDR